MRLIRALALAVALLCALPVARAQEWKQSPPSAGQVPGTPTNDNACAGCVGEFWVAATNSGRASQNVTFTNGSAVISWATSAAGYGAPLAPVPIQFTNSGGALPTNFTVNTVYYVDPGSISGLNFSVATSVALAIAHTDVVAGSAGTGTQSALTSVPLATGTAVDLTGFNLTPGDWDCTGGLNYSNGASSAGSFYEQSIGTTANTQTGIATNPSLAELPIASGNSATVAIPYGTARFSLAAATLIHFVGQATFTGGAGTAIMGGNVRCRRAR